MGMKDNKDGYLQYVDDENLIEGDPDGLAKLRNAIDDAIRNGYAGLDVKSSCNIFGVSRSDQEILSLSDSRSKRTVFGIVLGGLTFIWFVVLPFVAIGLLLYVLFFSDSPKETDHRSLYIQDLIKEQYQDKRN